MFPLNVIVGGSLSTTVTVCVQLDWLQEASVAVQVMVVVPFGYSAIRGWLSLRVPLMVGLMSQLSVAVAVPVTTNAAQMPGSVLVVMLDGQVIVGGVVSLTVNVTSFVVVLPAPLLLLEPSFAVR